MRGAGRAGRRTGMGVLAALLLITAAVTAATPALADTATDDRSAQAQAVLDRVLGPGNSVIEIAATVQAGSGSTTKVAWGTAPPAQVTASHVGAGGFSAGSVTSVNAVGSTTTTLTAPPGSLVRQTVAVAVNTPALGSVSVARLRRLVAAAVGLTPSRGDRLVLVSTPFAKQAAPAVAGPSWTDGLLGLAIPAIEVGGAVIALLVLVLALGGNRRRGDGDLRRS